MLALATIPFVLAWLNPIPLGSPTINAPTLTRSERIHFIVRFAVMPDNIRYGQSVQISYYVFADLFGYPPIFDGTGTVEFSTDKENWTEIFNLESMPMNPQRTNFTRFWSPPAAGVYYVRIMVRSPSYYSKVVPVNVAIAPTNMELQAQSQAAFGDKLEVRGRLLSFDAKPLAASAVTLTYTWQRGPPVIKQVRTVADGSFSDKFQAVGAGAWTVSAQYDGEPLRYEKSSITANFLMAPAPTVLLLESNPPSTIEGQSVQFSGTLKTQREFPVSANVKLVLIRPDGTRLDRMLTTDQNGKLLLLEMADQAGVWRAKAFFAGTQDYAASESPEITFTVAAKPQPANQLAQPLLLGGFLVAAFAVGIGAYLVIRKRGVSKSVPADSSAGVAG